MIQFKEANTIIELKQAYQNIKNIGELYPNFYDWYWNKVVPGVSTGNDKVVPGVSTGNDKVILAFKNNEFVGTSLIKDGEEKKLRALRIVDKYQQKGYGLHLIDKSLELLNCDKPLVTVNQHLLNDFSRIFINRYQFDMTHVHKRIIC